MENIFMEIINWLRGGNIFVLTLQYNPRNELVFGTEIIPEDLTKQEFTQWVFSNREELFKNLEGISNGLASAIYKYQSDNLKAPSNPLDALQVKSNPHIEKTIPDCVLVVDIRSNQNYKSNMSDDPITYFRLIVTQFVRTGNEWK